MSVVALLSGPGKLKSRISADFRLFSVAISAG
jgi:hypothetical protein